MAQSDTVDRILHAATVLFAERGFAETSLRTITSMADVNLAAVNYHFGTKKALIQAVFVRYIKPLCAELDKRLDEYEKEKTKGQKPSTEALLEILFEAHQSTVLHLNDKSQRLVRLISLAYTQSQEHLRQNLSGSYGDTYRRYTDLLKSALPHLNPVQFYWRLNFLLGSAIFTLSSFDSISAILSADFEIDMEISEATQLMIPALSGMLNAPNNLEC